MYKNILVISDNLILCEAFDKIYLSLNLQDSNLDYAISHFSNKQYFQSKLGREIYVFNLRINSLIEEILNKYDLVISLHCKQLFPPKLVRNLKCINIHPGYNPINRGWFPQVFSIIYDLPIGATIHEIDEDLDHGNIIVREKIEKYSYDTSETLYNRIIEKEIDLLNNNLLSIISNTYSVITPEDEGNLYLKRDFEELLEINLDHYTKIGDLINRLRALSHGNYNNAFFYDKSTGRKVYISLKLNHENNG